MTTAVRWTVPPGASGEPAGPLPTPTPAPVFAPAPTAARYDPNASLLALFLSLMGFVGVTYLLYEFKFVGVTATLHGIPTRALFVLFLALACSPYVLTIFRRVPFLFLLMPTVLVFFLYRLFSPFGLPFSRDPIFNFQFAQAILNSGSWSPTAGVTGQALTYSYYPGGAIFNVEVSTLTNLPLLNTFNWGFDLFRLLVIPLAIYAIAARLFSARSAPLAVFFYLGVPSIENNLPTQQDFAVAFFLLAIVVLTYLATSDRASRFLRFALLGFAVLVIVSHHVSTYILIAWLLGMALLPLILRFRDPYSKLRSWAVFVATTAVAGIWVLLVTLPVITQQVSILSTNVQAIFAPATKLERASRLGGVTFPVYQEVWIALGVAVLVLTAILTLVETYRRDEVAFITFSILAGFLVVVVAIPFVSTGFSFLALRVFEFAGVIFAPAAAWWLVHHLVERAPVRSAHPVSGGGHPPSASSYRRRGGGPRRPWAVAAVALAVLVFTGGSLVSLTTRDQFAGVGGVLIDSPLNINENAMEAVNWATAHMNQSKAIWGDYLVYDTFGGFGHFSIHYNSYPVFQGSTLCNISSLTTKGQYIVTDIYLSGTYPPPVFPGPAGNQPNGTYLPDYVDTAKFGENPQYFATLYENSVFTVYQIVLEPPAVGCP